MINDLACRPYTKKASKLHRYEWLQVLINLTWHPGNRTPREALHPKIKTAEIPPKAKKGIKKRLDPIYHTIILKK